MQFVRKTEPYRRQQRDEKDKEPKTGGKKSPIGEIRMILRGLVARGSSKSLKKAYARELNNVHSWLPPLKTPRCSKPDFVIFEKDVSGIRQAHDDPLVIMMKFPIAHDIREIRGDQVLARECYQATLASGENHTWMIDEPEPIPEQLEVP